MSHILFQGPVTLHGVGNVATDASRGPAFTVTIEGAAAVGSVTAVGSVNLIDGETFTITDGTTTWVFEFDDGGGVTPGNIAVVAVGVGFSSEEVANEIVYIMQSNATFNAAFTSSSALAVISLTANHGGTAGNVAITDTVTNAGFTHTGMADGTTAITLSNPTGVAAGMTISWQITNNAAGNGTCGFGTNFRWPGGTPPTITATANAVDVVTGICFDGTHLDCSFVQDLKEGGM